LALYHYSEKFFEWAEKPAKRAKAVKWANE